MLFFDPTMVILIPGIIISLIAQYKVKSTFRDYNKRKTVNGYTGQQIARLILDEAGLFDVPINITETELGDFYDPRNRTLTLSREVYQNSTIAAAGVAAHEVGHAIQHSKSYAPLIIRNSIVPVVNFSSNLSWIILILGLILSISPLVKFGIILFSVTVIFQIITLPVEFDASHRAITILKSKGILYEDEVKGASKVLTAAALTYVAAAITSILQLVRLLVLNNNRND